MSRVCFDEHILQIEDLSVCYFPRGERVPAVRNVSFAVRPGEAVGLVGESGCGKSTVALAIMRDLGRSAQIIDGRIRINGRDTSLMTEDELCDMRGADLAMVYQEPMASLNPALSVGTQLMEVPICHEGASDRQARERALEILHDVRLPDPERIMRSFPHQLSGGQQQRVVIAMALISKPALLILDEPTTALDVTVEASVLDLVSGLAKRYGTSILFISHNLGLIRATCDRMLVMYAGEIVESGTVEEVFDGARHPYTQALFRALPLPGSDKTDRPVRAIPGTAPRPNDLPPGCAFAPRCGHAVNGHCDSVDAPLTSIGSTRLSRCIRASEIDWALPPPDIATARPAAAIGPVILRAERVRKYFRRARTTLSHKLRREVVHANESVSLEARASETLAIVGESGCGKTTFAKIVAGLETGDGGQVVLDNRRIDDLSVTARDNDVVANVQMIFQNPDDTLNPAHCVGDQILRALEVFGVGDTPEARRTRVFELLDLVRLPHDVAERFPRQLSGGQKQRVAIARAFAGRARIVLADEPVSALDVSVQAAVSELLMDVQREQGATLIFISHDLSVVRYLSDRVAVMYLGHILEFGTTEQVFSPPYHPYTEMLLSAVPLADTRIAKREIPLDGDVPSASDPPFGCPFHPRCRWAATVGGDTCSRKVPPPRHLSNGHQIKCHLSEAQLDEMEEVFRLVAE